MRNFRKSFCRNSVRQQVETGISQVSCKDQGSKPQMPLLPFLTVLGLSIRLDISEPKNILTHLACNYRKDKGNKEMTLLCLTTKILLTKGTQMLINITAFVPKNRVRMKGPETMGQVFCCFDKINHFLHAFEAACILSHLSQLCFPQFTFAIAFLDCDIFFVITLSFCGCSAM